VCPIDLDKKAVRLLAVTTRRRRGEPAPEIRMTGEWLAAAGFVPGCKLAVSVSFGNLLVTIVGRPPEEVKRLFTELYADADPPDPKLVKRCIEDLQREYRRRFPKSNR